VHLQSKKHIAIYNEKNNITNANATVEVFKNEVISTLMSQLSYVLEENNKSILAEQTKVMIESQTKLMDEQQNKMNKMITEIANKPTITNNNTQTNNQQFNMNVFLNETWGEGFGLATLALPKRTGIQSCRIPACLPAPHKLPSTRSQAPSASFSPSGFGWCSPPSWCTV
jgi:hypothetical protein